MIVLCLYFIAGCTDQPPDRAPVVPPPAEFLIAAGDSSYWIRSGPDGLRVRSAPLLLTESEGAFFELRIAEQITDYFDAEFIRERLFGYTLDGGDSVLLFEDPAVALAMQQWVNARPEELPINPDSEDAPDPESSASDFLEVIDVHGRWVSWAHALDIDVSGLSTHTHVRRRGVADIRSGAAVPLDSLMSAAEVTRIVAAGRAALDTMLDVVRSASDDRAVRARESLHTFTFDALSFSVTDVARVPAIMFHVGGAADDGEALELLLPPVVLTDVPPWWADVRRTLPVWSGDSLHVRWSNSGYTVIGDVDSSRTRIALSLVHDSVDARPWPIAVVPMPTYQFMALDRPPLAASRREQLLRAFDRASGDDPYATRALGRARRSTTSAASTFRRTSHD